MSDSLLNHRYRILHSLGEGGFGKTFLAEDTQMPSRRQCVIKQLKPMSDRPEVFPLVQQRFAREAAVLEAVGKGHSQIPDLYAYFSENGLFYLVQEWAEGKPLSALANQPWPEEKVSALLVDALGALAHVHGQNIIHRDLKPDNIILRHSDQRPCLIDFGAVKELMSTVLGSGQQRSSLVIGTPGFMPPEQAAGRPVFSSDLYSLAMTMIYLLTGRSPAELPTNSHSGEVLWQQFVPNVSPSLTNVLTRAIHPYAQNRYKTAADMLAALPSTAIAQPSLPPLINGDPSSSQMPTVAVAAVTASQSELKGSKSVLVQPWKKVGLALGALVLGTGLWMGLRPQLSFQSSSSSAEPEDFRTAVENLEKKVSANPNDAASQVNLADAYWQVGDYDQAITILNPLISKEPTNALALIVKGKTQAVKGDYLGAIATFTQAAEPNSASATNERTDERLIALIERGNAYYETGEYDKAVDDYRSALRLDPKNSQAYREWSSVNVVQGNTQEALQNLDLAVENDPDSISAYTNRGSRRSELGDQVGAVEDWLKASKLPAQTADEYASRGYAKSRMNNKTGAVDDYNQALIINPNHVRSLMNRAYTFYEQGEKEQALSTLEKALAVNPNLVTGLILKGEIQAFGNPADWEGAIAAYSQALDVNPNDPDVLNNRCSAYFATQQLDLAIADCSQGLTVNPRSAALYVARGNIQLQQENYEKAIQDYSRTIELGDEIGGDPRRRATAYSNRASALMQVQDPKGALSDLNKALELNPNDPADLYKRGLVKVATGDREGGSTDLRQAADLYIKAGRTDSHQNVMAMIEQLGL